MNDELKNRPGHVAPEGYDIKKYDRPSVACDVVIISFRAERLEVLLIERKHPPYQGFWALPGGFVDMDETLEYAAAREVEEETSIDKVNLVSLGAFGDPGRDPRGRVISTAYLSLVRDEDVKPIAGDDAKNVKWFPLRRLPDLAFDHPKIIDAARRRLQEMAIMSPKLFELLPRTFPRDLFKKLCQDVMGKVYSDDGFYLSMENNPNFAEVKMSNEEQPRYNYNSSGYKDGDFMFLLLN